MEIYGDSVSWEIEDTGTIDEKEHCEQWSLHPDKCPA